jgi:hypothetical protein
VSKALEFLPHLRSFHWWGPDTDLPVDIAESLVNFCPQLQELRCPA